MTIGGVLVQPDPNYVPPIPPAMAVEARAAQTSSSLGDSVMAQGWNVNSTTDIITFFEAPPVGVNNIVVQRYSVPASGGATDVFALSAWGPKYGYPSDVEFYGDRLFFAGNTAQPQTVWASKIGNYPDFGKTVPSVDDDAITATLNARAR